MNTLLDDPANDSRPVGQLINEANRYQREVFLRQRLVGPMASAYPLDPADDPSFTKCQPYGLARQAFSRHQIEIKTVGKELHIRYGEWAAKRTIYMDGRKLPAGAKPTLMGYSVGRYEGNTLAIESTGIAPNRVMDLQHSPQLHIVERYTRSADGKRLLLTATLTDPVTFKEPLAVKRVWRWAPEAEIVDELHCEIPTDFRRGTREP